MRFLLDESSDARLASHPRQHGHDVTVIAFDYPASLADISSVRHFSSFSPGSASMYNIMYTIL